MEALLGLLGPVFDVSVSYKAIEQLYSDEEVGLFLHNGERLALNPGRPVVASYKVTTWAVAVVSELD